MLALGSIDGSVRQIFALLREIRMKISFVVCQGDLSSSKRPQDLLLVGIQEGRKEIKLHWPLLPLWGR